MATTLDDVAEAVSAALLDVLPFRGSDDALLIELVEELGWSMPVVPPVLRELDGEALGAAVGRLASLRRRAAAADELARAVVELTAALATFADTLDQLPERLRAELPAPFVAATRIDTQLRPRLVDHAVCRYLARRSRYALELARTLGIAIVEERAPRPEAFQPAYTHRELQLSRAMRLITDPRGLVTETLGWGGDALALEPLLAALLRLSIERDLPAHYAYPPKALAGMPPPGPGLLVPLFEHPPFRVIAGVFPGRSDAGKAGLLLMLATEGLLDMTLPLAADVSLQLSTTLAAPVVALQLHPDRAPELVAAPFDGGAMAVSGGLTATLRLGSATEQRPLLELGPLVLSGRGGYLRAGASRAQEVSDAFVELGLDGGKLALALDGDGLLGSLIPLDKLELELDLALGWSLVRGTYLAGHAGLDLTVPTERRLGPVSLTAIGLAVRMRDEALVVTGSVAGTVALGPVELEFAGLGAELVARAGGRLGVADVAASPRGPERIGLGIAAPLVSGEGTIAHDPAAGRYAGSFMLAVGPVAVQAAAMLDRAAPGRRPSVTVLASSRFPRIPLGQGFTLDGIGALLATERRIDLDAIRAGLRTGRIAALLGDPSEALAVVPALFPPAPGRVVVGVYAKLGWGTPQVIDARVLPVFELPAPIKIALLGTLELGLPTLEQRVVDLRVDALGTLDLERRTLAIDASLHDSSIAGNPLTGDMALRLSLGDAPTMLLSVGGFHPRFSAPAGFPTLRRIELAAGDNPQLRLSAYVAVSFVSAQIGAHVDLRARGGGFEIRAQLGFDALFELFPFHFDVEVDARAAISWHGRNLLGVRLDFQLTGPRPYHARGSASFSVLWWDISVGFDKTWGDATPLPVPPPPDLAAVLRDALERPEAWGIELPARARPLLALADGVAREAVPPTARLVIRQRALPLAFGITRFGNLRLPAERRFAIARVRVADAEVEAAPVAAPFAIGQFTELSDDEKLAAPAFEQFAAGVRVGDGAVRTGPSARAAIDLDTVVVDPLAPPAEAPRPSVLDGRLAANLAALRARRVAIAAEPPPQLHDLRFVIASAIDLAPVQPAGTFAHARELLRAQDGQGLQIVPAAHAR